MAISFKYKKIKRGDGIERKLPYIPVYIKGEASWIQVMALLDSGADVSVISLDLAELLNLDLSGKEEFSKGIGGKVRVKNSKMLIEVKNVHESYSFEIPVQVILDKTDSPPIIGRDGFFDKFIIELDHSGERIRLKRITVHNITS